MAEKKIDLEFFKVRGQRQMLLCSKVLNLEGKMQTILYIIHDIGTLFIKRKDVPCTEPRHMYKCIMSCQRNSVLKLPKSKVNIKKYGNIFSNVCNFFFNRKLSLNRSVKEMNILMFFHFIYSWDISCIFITNTFACYLKQNLTVFSWGMWLLVVFSLFNSRCRGF